jgi:protein-L-isoaspartate(D-aspartate) O-methyltransferase
VKRGYVRSCHFAAMCAERSTYRPDAVMVSGLAEGPPDALGSFAGCRVSLNGDQSNPLVALKRSTRNRGPIGDRTIMKTSLLLVLSMVAVAWEATAQDAQCVRERAAMVETIRAYAGSDASVLGQHGLSERVLEAMGQTKRHLFIPERSCSIAYADSPIPIGLGQTMSQPFIVALMTQLAEVAPDHVVLEVGTGSGYQAAILAHLARKVCTIEIIPPLAEAAAKTLRDLAYDNVSVRLGDGYDGWPECGPFDAIVVTAALGEPPPPLIEQLKVGGRLVMPVGPGYTTQHLTVVEKIAPGKTTTRAVALVRFVPFTRSQN